MTGLYNLIKRNSKLYFKDKGMFFPSLITPLILLVLYATFLARVYKSSFLSNIPSSFPVDEKLIDAVVGGQLLASLLAVSAVTVAFCSNLVMIQDKVTKSRLDLTVTPVKKSTLALGYYISGFLSTFLVCLVAMGAGFAYLAVKGWYLSAGDVLYLLLDIFLLTMFGTALSSIINSFLSTQGQMSAVGTIVSSCYGFICGAYMPISQFGEGLQKVLSFLPGTYGTALVKNHTLNGAFRAMTEEGFPTEVIEVIKSSIDCNISFLGNNVTVPVMYMIMGGTVLLLIGIYVLLNLTKREN